MPRVPARLHRRPQGLPPVVELDVDLDSRADDDTQRGQLSLRAGGELLHPMRRHQLSASPGVEIQIGDHVDINLSFSITKRELPGPDPDAIDPEDYAQLSRLSYAEPLSMYGSFSVKIHWDRTSGARNDRLDEL